ncbi:MAG: hypothetical protein LGB72_03370 [Sulfurovum sp.]|nr:hypothetical protein [Sulfurovum sp.]MCB4765085.1 hypothetical protein [Sulfurovum sp.]MCB4772100.1 hypothetical protein [Sulfurovum sp.]MCB4777243.1 hypothetical protein [Sulfurovum sp.]MCB4778611.1 hypothetical protein [Sulfurovum sp.]
MKHINIFKARKIKIDLCLGKDFTVSEVKSNRIKKNYQKTAKSKYEY